MGAINQNQRNPTLEQAQEKSIKLSVLLGRDSFFYALFDERGNSSGYRKFIRSDKKSIYSNWVLDKFNEDQVLKVLQPLVVRVGICSNQYTLMPVPFFEEQHKLHYIQRNTPFNPPSNCWVDSLTTRQFIKVIYSVPNQILKIINYLGAEATVKHQLTTLISLFYQKYAAHRPHCALIHVRNNAQIILVFREGKLIFSNSYTFRLEDDFYYYLSMVLSRFEINPKSIELFLSGEIFFNTPKYKWLKKRFTHLHFASYRPKVVSKSKKSEPMAHELFDLYSQIME